MLPISFPHRTDSPLPRRRLRLPHSNPPSLIWSLFASFASVKSPGFPGFKFAPIFPLDRDRNNPYSDGITLRGGTMMKTPAACREPGIPALTLPASDPPPSPHFAFFAVKNLDLMARISGLSRRSPGEMGAKVDLRLRRPVSSVVRKPIRFAIPDLHFVAPALHQIAVDCGKLHQIAPCGLGGASGSHGATGTDGQGGRGRVQGGKRGWKMEDRR